MEIRRRVLRKKSQRGALKLPTLFLFIGVFVFFRIKGGICEMDGDNADDQSKESILKFRIGVIYFRLWEW